MRLHLVVLLFLFLLALIYFYKVSRTSFCNDGRASSKLDKAEFRNSKLHEDTKKRKIIISEKIMTLIDDDRDDELCDEVYLFLNRKYDNCEISKYEEYEQVITYVWYTNGIIGNGGFEYLFSAEFREDPYYENTVKAYEQTGLNEAAAIIKRALSIFKGNKPNSDVYQKLSPEERSKLDTEFYRVTSFEDDYLEAGLAKFIRDNRYQFGYKDSVKRLQKVKRLQEKRRPPENIVLELIEVKDYAKLKTLLGEQNDLLDKPGNARFKNAWGKNEFEVIKPIEYAVRRNDLESLKILANSSKISTIDKYLRSALIHSSMMNYTEIISFLIGLGIDVNCTNSLNMTPLMIAAKNGNIDSVTLLLKVGANTKVIDRDGTNCLYNVRDVETAKMLIKAGAEVNVIDNDGDTPLHVTCINGFVDLAKYLISVGADANVRNEEGKTALDIAKEDGFFNKL